MSKCPTQMERRQTEKRRSGADARLADDMKDLTIPPAPVGSARAIKTGAPAPTSPLDAAFIARVYRSMLWFGVVCTLLAAFAFQSGPALVSFVGGLVLAGLLLRGQEVAVRALLQPKEKMMGLDPRLAMVLLLPLKFVGVVAVLVAFMLLGWLRLLPLGLGFFAGQVVLIAKFAGWWLERARLAAADSK